MSRLAESKVSSVIAVAVLVLSIVFVVLTLKKRLAPLPEVKVDTSQPIPGPGEMVK